MRTRRPFIANRPPLTTGRFSYDPFFDIAEPDLILPGLYQGGWTSAAIMRRLGITAIINMDGSPEQDMPKGVPIKYLWHPIGDGYLPDLKALHEVALQGAVWLEAGETLLVHCAQGWNRSGLMNGLILILGGYVTYGTDAVKLIQNNRKGALGNRCFRVYLTNYEQDPDGLDVPDPWVLPPRFPLLKIDDLGAEGDDNDPLLPWDLEDDLLLTD